jgi:hypothetical protein
MVSHENGSVGKKSIAIFSNRSPLRYFREYLNGDLLGKKALPFFPTDPHKGIFVSNFNCFDFQQSKKQKMEMKTVL